MRLYEITNPEQLDEAPYLGKKYVPVRIYDIISNNGAGQFRFSPQAIIKQTGGASPVVKFKDGKYYTFKSEDDKTVTIMQIGQQNDSKFVEVGGIFDPKTLGVPYKENNYTHYVDISMNDFLKLAGHYSSGEAAEFGITD
jgi:hypothetical protein